MGTRNLTCIMVDGKYRPYSGYIFYQTLNFAQMED